MSEPVSPYPFQHLWLYVLLILDILWVWNDNHIEVLIHISLITSAIELFFICFCKHFQKRYSNLLPIFKLGCLIFLSCRSSSYILNIKSIFEKWFSNFFTHRVYFLFTFITESFDAQMIFILRHSYLSKFLLLLILWL